MGKQQSRGQTGHAKEPQRTHPSLRAHSERGKQRETARDRPCSEAWPQDKGKRTGHGPRERRGGAVSARPVQVPVPGRSGPGWRSQCQGSTGVSAVRAGAVRSRPVPVPGRSGQGWCGQCQGSTRMGAVSARAGWHSQVRSRPGHGGAVPVSSERSPVPCPSPLSAPRTAFRALPAPPRAANPEPRGRRAPLQRPLTGSYPSAGRGRPDLLSSDWLELALVSS